MSFTEHLCTHTKEKKNQRYIYIPDICLPLNVTSKASTWRSFFPDLHVLVVTTSTAACVIQNWTQFKQMRSDVPQSLLGASSCHGHINRRTRAAPTRALTSLALLWGWRRAAAARGSVARGSSVKRATHTKKERKNKKNKKKKTKWEPLKENSATRHSLVVKEAVALVECRWRQSRAGTPTAAVTARQACPGVLSPNKPRFLLSATSECDFLSICLF